MNGHICEFTLKHYRWLLEQALASSFTVLPLGESQELAPGKKQLILRHDIDFSVEDAYRMALLEHQMGVRATYCVLLHSPTYNIGERASYEGIRGIHALGHEIALHYDMGFFKAAGITPLRGINIEVAFLSELLGQEIRSVSQHRPATDGIFAGAASRYTDAYDPKLCKQILYVSDSRQTWRAGCLHEHLAKAEKMQVLIHPEWWEAEETQTRRETINRFIRERQNQIATALEEYAKRVEIQLTR